MKIKKHKEKSRLIVYQGNQILVLHKKTTPLQYGLIGGFLKKRESPEDGLIRETYEETLVRLSKQDLNYQCSITIESKNQYKLSKHYFISNQYNKEFILAEPHKFKKLEWVYWKEALKFLGKSDQKVIKKLFKPCKV